MRPGTTYLLANTGHLQTSPLIFRHLLSCVVPDGGRRQPLLIELRGVFSTGLGGLGHLEMELKGHFKVSQGEYQPCWALRSAAGMRLSLDFRCRVQQPPAFAGMLCTKTPFPNQSLVFNRQKSRPTLLYYPRSHLLALWKQEFQHSCGGKLM